MDNNLNELKNRFNENLTLLEQKFKLNNQQLRDFVEKALEDF